MRYGNAAPISAADRRIKHAKKLTLVGILSTFVLSFISFDAAAETKIVFGAYSSDRPSEMVAQIHPTLDAISKKMSEMHDEKVTFHMQFVPEYKKGVDLLVTRKFDIMRLGPASYVMAKKRAPEISILAMENKRGRKSYNGAIARPDLRVRFKALNPGPLFGATDADTGGRSGQGPAELRIPWPSRQGRPGRGCQAKRRGCR
jgi:hypothetical protein